MWLCKSWDCSHGGTLYHFFKALQEDRHARAAAAAVGEGAIRQRQSVSC
jgi:hypothetical protein